MGEEVSVRLVRSSPKESSGFQRCRLLTREGGRVRGQVELGVEGDRPWSLEELGDSSPRRTRPLASRVRLPAGPSTGGRDRATPDLTFTQPTGGNLPRECNRPAHAHLCKRSFPDAQP